ncbi:MAG: hypothetical protein CMM94_05885 [Rickettsiales bacterium]|nr:hypothetical protein [Rickettsiales bacterium]
MRKTTRKLLYVFYKAGDNLVENDGVELAGYLTFLAMLSLFPFLVLIVAFAGFIGQGQLGTQFLELMIAHLPTEAVEALRPRIDEIISGPPQTLLTVSILGAIWTSSSAVEGLRTVLNRAYQVRTPPAYIWRRLTSILQIILFAILIIIVMLVIVLAPIVIAKVQQFTGFPISDEDTVIWNKYFVYFGGVLLFLGVANLYYFLPNIKQSLVSVVPGALLVVVLWIFGAGLFTWYISNVDQVNIIYGSLGGLIASLLFFFIMSIVFIYGAEFNHMLLSVFGGKMEEREHVEEDESEDISLTDD